MDSVAFRGESPGGFRGGFSAGPALLVWPSSPLALFSQRVGFRSVEVMAGDIA